MCKFFKIPFCNEICASIPLNTSDNLGHNITTNYNIGWHMAR